MKSIQRVKFLGKILVITKDAQKGTVSWQLREKKKDEEL
jgi:hypothetical protein